MFSALRHPAVQGASLAAVVVLPLALALAWFLAQQVVQHSVRLAVEQMRPTEEIYEACTADPEAFYVDLPPTGVGHAYDPDGRSANPAAPPVPPEVLMASRERPITFVARGDTEESYLVRRLADSGPCALVWAHYLPGDEQLDLRHTLTFVVVVGALSSTLAASGLALLPILLRVRRLEAVARQVGTDGALEADDHPDALGRVSHALLRSHDRVRAMLSEEVAQRRAVLQHMDDIAHDLHAPLTNVLIALQRSQAAGRADEHIDEALGELVYIGNLTRNLYIRSWYRLRGDGDAGAERAWVDVRPMVERAVGRGRAMAGDAKTVEGWWPDGRVAVATHPVVFEQLVSNLICNAVAHNGPGVTVTALLEVVDSGFRLVVADDGCGLPAPIDELLQRGVGANSGLGLAIVRQICEREGWELDIDGSDGVTAVVRGPVAPADGPIGG